MCDFLSRSDTNTNTHGFIHIYVHACMHMYMHTLTRVYTYIRLCVYVYGYAHSLTHIHIYISISKHTHWLCTCVTVCDVKGLCICNVGLQGLQNQRNIFTHLTTKGWKFQSLLDNMQYSNLFPQQKPFEIQDKNGPRNIRTSPASPDTDLNWNLLLHS